MRRLTETRCFAFTDDAGQCRERSTSAERHVRICASGEQYLCDRDCILARSIGGQSTEAQIEQRFPTMRTLRVRALRILRKTALDFRLIAAHDSGVNAGFGNTGIAAQQSSCMSWSRRMI